MSRFDELALVTSVSPVSLVKPNGGTAEMTLYLCDIDVNESRWPFRVQCANEDGRRFSQGTGMAGRFWFPRNLGGDGSGGAHG